MWLARRPHRKDSSRTVDPAGLFCPTGAAGTTGTSGVKGVPGTGTSENAGATGCRAVTSTVAALLGTGVVAKAIIGAAVIP